MVKSTIKAIQLKAVPEVLEGHAPGSKEVLDMIDDLFDNFFESQKSSETAKIEDGSKKSKSHLNKNPSRGKVPRIHRDSDSDSEKDSNADKNKQDDKDSKQIPKNLSARSVSKGKVPRLRRESKEESEKDQKSDSEKDPKPSPKSDLGQWWKDPKDDKDSKETVSKGKVPKNRRISKEESEKDQNAQNSTSFHPVKSLIFYGI